MERRRSAGAESGSEPLASRARRAGFWASADAGVRTVLGFAVTVVLARILQPAEFGVLAMAMAFYGLAAVVSDSGVGTALIQRRNITHEEESAVFFFNLMSSLLLAACMLGIAPLAASFLRNPELQQIIGMLAGGLLLGALGSIHVSLLTRSMQLRTIARVNFWSTLLSGALAVALALWGFGVYALAWQFLVQSFVQAALLWTWHPWKPTLVWRMACLPPLLQFGWRWMAARLIDTAYLQVSNAVVGKVFGANDLGLYTRAQSTQQLPTTLLSGVLSRVFLPAFSEASGSRVRLANALARSSQIAMMVSVPAMLGLALVAEPVVLMLFGPSWSFAAELLRVLCLAGMLMPLHVLNLSALLAQGRAGLVLRIELLKKCFALSFFSAACFHGLEAIAWSQVATSLVSFFVNAYCCGRTLGFGAWRQIGSLWRVALAGLIMAAAVAGADLLSPGFAPVRLAWLVAVGIGTYLFSCLLLQLASISQIWSAVQSLLRRPTSS